MKKSYRKKFHVSSDSKSAFQALNKMKVNIPLVSNSLDLLLELRARQVNFTIILFRFMWEFEGNEAATTSIHYANLKHCITVADLMERRYLEQTLSN